MQPLTGDTRSDLTEKQVSKLLQSDSALEISYGAYGLGPDFGHIADISKYIGNSSSITSDIGAKTQRSCNLSIDSDVTDVGWDYLSGFILPFMTLKDPSTDVKAEFHLGVYTLTTPDRDLGVEPATLSFSGYDLIYLLRQEVGDSYEVEAGSDPAQAAARAIGIAIPGVTVLVTPSETTTNTQMSWPFDAENPTTYLDIVQKLLSSIGFRRVWVDWDGKFRIEPYTDLKLAPIEWVFNIGDVNNIVSNDRKQSIDLYNIPNWFRFVMEDLPDLPAEGETMFTYEDSSIENPGSTANRGGRRVKKIESVAATSYNSLVIYAQNKIDDLLSPSEQFSVKTQPFPLAWHMDIIKYMDPSLDKSLPLELSGERRVIALKWSLPLDGMSDMQWTWQTITDETAQLGLAESQVEDNR